MRDPPSELHALGRLPCFSRAVSIVGTRRADPEALRFTRALSQELAEAGCTIVSGGALGIDAAAHRGALDAGGATVAVLASGLSPAYPPEHRALFAQIAEHGLLLSEPPDGTPVRGFLFLRRNRLVGALSRVVVVVQAPERSGALSTAAHARRAGGIVLVVPAAPWDARGRGNLHLLEDGARLCVDADSVLSALSDPDVHTPNERQPTARPARRRRRKMAKAPARPPLPDLDPDAAEVLAQLGATPRSPDQLAQTLDWTAPRVSRALFELLLSGCADERFGSYVRLLG